MNIQNIHGKTYLALKSGLDQWTQTPVYYPFDSYSPQANAAFLIVDPVNLDFGDNSISYDCGDEHRGFWNIRVMTPMSWTYAASAGLVGGVSELFKAGYRFEYQDARVEIYRQPQAQGFGQLEVSWNRQDVRIYWRCWG